MHCFTSLPILDEVREVLLRPKFKLNAERVFKMIEELHALCEVVTPTRSISVVVNDPDDDIILECAFAARAEIIVSGDSHLLDLEFWEGIPIITPADAIKQIDHS